MIKEKGGNSMHRIDICRDPSEWLTQLEIQADEKTARLIIKGPQNQEGGLKFKYLIPYADGLAMCNPNSEKWPTKKEHERKFLIQSEDWRNQVESKKTLRQLYVCQDPSKWLTRVRLCDEEAVAWLTIKGPKVGVSNPEFEYLIPYSDALMIWDSSPGLRLSKIRSIVRARDGVWEVDEFLDEGLCGLVVAEFEMPHPDFKIEKSAWVGKEVSLDPSYRNDHLAVQAKTAQSVYSAKTKIS